LGFLQNGCAQIPYFLKEMNRDALFSALTWRASLAIVWPAMRPGWH